MIHCNFIIIILSHHQEVIARSRLAVVSQSAVKTCSRPWVSTASVSAQCSRSEHIVQPVFPRTQCIRTWAHSAHSAERAACFVCAQRRAHGLLLHTRHRFLAFSCRLSVFCALCCFVDLTSRICSSHSTHRLCAESDLTKWDLLLSFVLFRCCAFSCKLSITSFQHLSALSFCSFLSQLVKSQYKC